ncbi:beta-1,3-galactosyltransferase 5 isoform X2 [Neocloeon triangulifer]|nr:beta-1,3-galactosyltransferase 5 isoform X2 [Neocloeon triangulifer]
MEQMEVPRPKYRRPPVLLQQDQHLLNFTTFHYLASPYACHPDEEVKALIVITSHAGDLKGRTAHRNGMPLKVLAKMGVRRIFSLALPRKDQKGYNFIEQKEVEKEAMQYDDIIQGNFLEDYHNLTYKHAMSLQWAVQFCPQAKFLIKQDDDIAVDLPRLLALAPSLVHQNMIGYVLDGMTPERHKTKWRVSKTDWPSGHYPRFLSGWLYVTTPAVASKVLQVLGADFFWIDDMFITGVGSERAKVPLMDLSPHFAINSESVHCCLQGRGCDFVVAPTGADWHLLEEYLRLTRTTAANRRGRGNCVVTEDPNEKPWGPGRGQIKAVGL